jgi:hypothetical protein
MRGAIGLRDEAATQRGQRGWTDDRLCWEEVSTQKGERIGTFWHRIRTLVMGARSKQALRIP